jgi:hypothetical protein
MKIFIGSLLFIIINLIIIPTLSLFYDGWLFYLGSILTFIQIVIGFSVAYGIMVNKLLNNGDGHE